MRGEDKPVTTTDTPPRIDRHRSRSTTVNPHKGVVSLEIESLVVAARAEKMAACIIGCIIIISSKTKQLVKFFFYPQHATLRSRGGPGDGDGVAEQIRLVHEVGRGGDPARCRMRHAPLCLALDRTAAAARPRPLPGVTSRQCRAWFGSRVHGSN